MLFVVHSHISINWFNKEIQKKLKTNLANLHINFFFYFAHSHIHKKTFIHSFIFKQSNPSIEFCYIRKYSFFLWDVLQFIRHSTSGAGKRKYYYSKEYNQINDRVIKLWSELLRVCPWSSCFFFLHIHKLCTETWISHRPWF